MPRIPERAGDVAPWVGPPSSAPPARVAGRAIQPATRVDMRVSPTRASRTSAAYRDTSLATRSHRAVAVATTAAAVNATASPSSMGATSRTNDRPPRAKTSGSTGRMHGLRIVSTPPRKASTNIARARYELV